MTKSPDSATQRYIPEEVWTGHDDDDFKEAPSPQRVPWLNDLVVPKADGRIKGRIHYKRGQWFDTIAGAFDAQHRRFLHKYSEDIPAEFGMQAYTKDPDVALAHRALAARVMRSAGFETRMIGVEGIQGGMEREVRSWLEVSMRDMAAGMPLNTIRLRQPLGLDTRFIGERATDYYSGVNRDCAAVAFGVVTSGIAAGAIPSFAAFSRTLQHELLCKGHSKSLFYDLDGLFRFVARPGAVPGKRVAVYTTHGMGLDEIESQIFDRIRTVSSAANMSVVMMAASDVVATDLRYNHAYVVCGTGDRGLEIYDAKHREPRRVLDERDILRRWLMTRMQASVVVAL